MTDEQVSDSNDASLREALRGSKAIKVEIEMLEETCQEALRLAGEAGWEQGEALLGVFASGVAYLRSELRHARLMDGSTSHAAAMQEMAEHCTQLESMCSVLKFRAFDMARDRKLPEQGPADSRSDSTRL